MRQLMIFAVLIAVTSGCGVSQQEYVAKESEANRYKQELRASEQKNQALDSQLSALQKQIADLRTKVDTASVQKSHLEAKNTELTGRQAEVLNTQMLFPANSSKLTPEVKRSLDTMAEAVTQLKGKSLIVTAYTDDTEGGKNGPAKRWQLSTARAMEVAKYLVGRGLDPAMVGVAGFGDARPAAPNDSIANRALNRRVEVVVTPPEFKMKGIDVNPATLN